jgi:hypothetical protein
MEIQRDSVPDADSEDLIGVAMQALHSCSALVCNVFDYWRDRDCSALAGAIALPSGIRDIEFERKFPTGLPGNPPNIDVVLSLYDGSIIAIKSKFFEPYWSRHISGFKNKYFTSEPGYWERSGCSKCQSLASRLHSGDIAFRWLNAEQLLKQVLGLAGFKKRWELLYLWYGACLRSQNIGPRYPSLRKLPHWTGLPSNLGATSHSSRHWVKNLENPIMNTCHI